MNAENDKSRAAEPFFAGAGARVPVRAERHPAFYERVPMLRCFADTLHRCVRLQKHAYKKEGRFFVAEAGTYRGRGLLAMIETAASIDIKVHVTGLDSFEGFPPLSDRDRSEAPADAKWVDKRIFADTTLREVEAFLGPKLSDEYTLVKGFFNDSLPTLPERKYAFVLIDCDLYSSHIDCMDYFYNRLLPGGAMFFDDYHSRHYPMAKSAIDDFMANKKERLFHLGFDATAENSVKAYIIKSQ